MSMIYCVEDDNSIRGLVEYTLRSSGFDVKGFENGSDFFEILEKSIPDLVLLDIMLPDTDGMEILKIIRQRKEFCTIPVIMLTAKSERMDKIMGLDGGADDYITKPFDVLELVSRVKAVLRRSDSHKQDTVIYKDINLNYETRRVTVSGEDIILTYKEFELLYLLMSDIGMVYSREKLMNEIWGTDFEGESRTVDVHIRTLRQKLKTAGKYIITVRNVGYKIGE